MRHACLAALCLLIVPASTRAQVENAFTCVLGIYDDVGLTACSGILVPGILKDLYVGVRFDPASGFDRSSGLEFSVAGIGDGLYLVPAPGCDPWWHDCCETPQSPADTSATSTGTGGCSVALHVCVEESQALVRLTVVALSEVHDRFLEIKRKYPPSNPAWHTPLFMQCDAPAFTPVRVTGGCYVLNPTGPLPESCSCSPTAIEPGTWSSVKQLFR